MGITLAAELGQRTIENRGHRKSRNRNRERTGSNWEQGQRGIRERIGQETGKIKTEWKQRHRKERQKENKDRAEADRKHR
jgi:hypothetical protein